MTTIPDPSEQPSFFPERPFLPDTPPTRQERYACAFPLPGEVLDRALGAILAYLYESAALCDQAKSCAFMRWECYEADTIACPAFDGPAQLGATLLLRRGLSVGFSEAHAALEAARDLLRCSSPLREAIGDLCRDLAEDDPGRRWQVVALLIARDLVPLREEPGCAPEEAEGHALECISGLLGIEPAQAARCLPAARALAAMEIAGL